MLQSRNASALLLLAWAVGCRTGLPIDGREGGGGEGAGVAPFCGDGVIGGDEECDGEDLGGVDCTDFGFGNPGVVLCGSDCLLDMVCNPVCGNSVIEQGENCDDGNTTPGDGCNATCFNEDDACGVAIPITLEPGAVSMFGTLGGSANHVPNASPECPAGVGVGPENVYAISVTIQGHVTAWLPGAGTNFDSILYSRTSCITQSAELSCHDNDAGVGAGEVITTWLEPGETFYVIVDTAGASVGDYELVLDLSRGGLCDDEVPITIEGTKPLKLLGRISSLANDASANGCSGEGLGPDAVYGFTFTESAQYQFDLETDAFDSIAHARTSCADAGTELTCNSPSGSFDSSLTLTGAEDATRFFWVDSVDGAAGPYTITVTH